MVRFISIFGLYINYEEIVIHHKCSRPILWGLEHCFLAESPKHKVNANFYEPEWQKGTATDLYSC